MRFSVAAVLAFAASAIAQTADFDPIYTPNSGETIDAGAPYTVTWSSPAKYMDGTVSIELIGGKTQNTQQHIADIASGIKNSANKYTWNVDASLGAEAVYGLVFKLESNSSIFQYSNPFHIRAAAKPAPSSASQTVTVTQPPGVKTIILSGTIPTSTSSSAAPTSTICTSSTSSTSSTSIYKTVQYNVTVCPTTLVPSASQYVPVNANSSTGIVSVSSPTAPAPVPTAAAAAIRIGSLGILGVVAAVLAL
ncbi:uncharacterized protein UV8b_02092 [Ustilaginoidea virens]|uniref:Yeast cell wall synthesis Kre9/Knh1-like N-terminal domain-containing protein n=1 Tax=Ustilaginoidea virens TaxID=1159556 RepID=A0A8E5MF79_USTVR|nr:uncharacterized protein UV8b_02092 [Ustilaginoidea virens]QUC17851.1 hypothetical protein UV8b_02092 [Ustilaginoidea virens]